MSAARERLALDDVAQFDARLQLAVLDATARIYAAALTISNTGGGIPVQDRHGHAREAVDDYLQLVSPLILGAGG